MGHQQKHNVVQTFHCDICDSRFLNKFQLTRHKKTHSGNKSFQCKTCDTWFWSRSELKRHQQRHNGEEPFKCDSCESRFFQKSDLIMHQRRLCAGKKVNYESTFFVQCHQSTNKGKLHHQSTNGGDITSHEIDFKLEEF